MVGKSYHNYKKMSIAPQEGPVASSVPPEEADVELTLRPTRWDEYVGQEKTKANLQLMIDAAKGRKENCEHILFYGQPGLGKTTLAYLIGREMGVAVKSTSGPALEKAGDLAALLSNLEPNDILFIDEAHRLAKPIEEILYPAMESRRLHLIVGKGPSARTFSLDLPPFTVIAATTKASMISAPLRSRFGATFRLEYYSTEDIAKILERSARILRVAIDKTALTELALASRFTPRIANRLLRRTRDYAQVRQGGRVDKETVEKTLEMLEIDKLGLEQTDRQLLSTIITRFHGGPVGIKSISAALNEDPDTVEDVYEPFLIKLGLLHRGSAGRVVTKQAYEHLNAEGGENALL